MYTKELSEVTGNIARRNGNSQKTFPGPEQPISEPGKLESSLRRKEILSASGRERNLEKTFPSSSRQSLNWGIYSLCTGLSDRFFQKAAENAMRIASNNETVHDGLYG